ncbi:MAG TPA: DUF4440 domain-containing protein [Micromonosporaceae bacterium]|nr:DUF4440 domain-containing protein [Micromonosporaceae bacterium]HCU50155.1 DUF4440 domain-containing protein [Micromonosporaceae bacterium]
MIRRLGSVALTLTTALAIAGCGQESAGGQPTGVPDKQVIAQLFTEWDAALATGDPQKVADRYAADAVLLPTVSNQVRTDRNGIVDYFQHFLEAKPRGTIITSVVSVLDPDTAVDTGTYRFALVKDGKQQQVDARYTFVYELRSGRWLIVNHHSSAMPEKTTS